MVPSELWTFLDAPDCDAPGCFLDLKRNAILNQPPTVPNNLAIPDKMNTTSVLDETWPLPTLQLHSLLNAAQQDALFARHRFVLDMEVFRQRLQLQCGNEYGRIDLSEDKWTGVTLEVWIAAQ